MHHKFYLGDVRDCLKHIPDNTIQCVVTSPPYWALRDYGVEGQIGLEKTLQEFVITMVDVFREVKRVLRADGTLWINLGDSYCSTAPGTMGDNLHIKECLEQTKRARKIMRPEIPEGLKPKDLCGVPWRVALALQADGWYLRSDIIWAKPNPMPGSQKDRPTTAHEYLFLLSKKAHYYYDNESIKEEQTDSSKERAKYTWKGNTEDNSNGSRTGSSFKKTAASGEPMKTIPENGKRNKRTVWEIATQGCKEAHFATFPTELVEPCILAGTSPKACPKCLAPWKRVLEPSEEYAKMLGRGYHDHSDDLNQGMSQQKKMPKTFADYKTIDWEPTCKCKENDGSGRCIVLDPFGGSGTVTYVSQALGRESIYIDLNSKYLHEIALPRNGFTGLCHADTFEIIDINKLNSLGA
jgi:DNA modification methylase